MNPINLIALFYFAVGCSFIYFFQKRRKGVASIGNDLLPELSNKDLKDLKILLKTAYERMLYLGVLFIPLAFSTFQGGDRVSSIFFLLLIGLLFISNIMPRHKIVKLLENNGLSLNVLQERGIKL